MFNYFRKHNDVYIATSFDSNRKKKNRIFQFNVKGNFVKGYYGETLKYQEFLINNNFDIIFFNAAQQWSFDLALPILENIKAKKIIFPCGFSRLDNILYYPYFKLIKNKINYFDKVVCTYKNLKDYKFISKYYKKKIYLINNGTNRIRRNLSRQKFLNKFKLKKKTNLFINISNIKFNKGQIRTINLFKKINTNNATMFFMGKNNSFLYFFLFKIVIYLFNILNHEKKIIYLNSNNKTKNDLYHHAEFFLFGSRIEYDPLVMYESIVSNTKFISYEVGSCKNVINRKIGLVTNDNKKKIKYINNQINKKNNYKEINKYYWSHICKKYSEIFIS